MIIINFKNYVFGDRALALARLIEKRLPEAVVAVSPVDVGYISKHTKLNVLAQHVDFCKSEMRSTGFVTARAIKSYEAFGSLVNHSEHQLKKEEVNKVLSVLKENKLNSILCAPSLKEAKKLKTAQPYALAFEDAELIATKKSITSYRKKEIVKFVKLLSRTNIIPICGAGINSVEDVEAAQALGCRGVLISSAVANVSLKKAEKLLKQISDLKKF